ncbi:MAG: hypothetical protein LBB54_01410 [Cellulomonadaceae bacterium]|nr:hypothetical protein [Cellulomonadaceae bacterium]
MTLPLTITVVVLCIAAAGWAVASLVHDRAPSPVQLTLPAMIEVLLAVQVVMFVVRIHQAPHNINPALLAVFAVSALVVLPLAVLWSLVERTRWASVVRGVAALFVAFLTLRLWQLWTVT